MGFFVEKRVNKNIIVALPVSILSVLPSLREKTLTIGMIARILSIFRVNKLVIYRDIDSNKKDVFIFKEVLEYILTPPYLRRTLIKKKPVLRYVGLLKPLQIPSHNVSPKLVAGEYREGVIIKVKNNVIYINVGLTKPIMVKVNKDSVFKKGQRVIVFIESTNPMSVKLIENRDEINVYWGFSFEISNNIIDVLRKFSGSKNIVIATSRYGKYIGDVVDKLSKDLKKSNDILVLFGGPKKGLYGIFADEGLALEENVDYVVNFVKKQGTKTIRTEEALPIVLSLIDFLLEQ